MSEPEVMWQGRFIAVVRDGQWEYVRRARGIRAVVILADTDDGEIVLVEQYRVPIGRRCLELPAGLIGAVLKEHFPKTSGDVNEIPDKLIEL